MSNPPRHAALFECGPSTTGLVGAAAGPVFNSLGVKAADQHVFAGHGMLARTPGFHFRFRILWIRLYSL
jgi:hypothetical protein